MAKKSEKKPAADAGEVLASGFLRTEWMDPARIAAHPDNAREHPAEQVAALRESIEANGFSKPLILNERTKKLVDGHARLSVALAIGLDSVPVNVGDWSEAQEAYLLATLDPMASMAKVREAAFDRLRARMGEIRPATAALLDATRSDPFFKRGLGGISLTTGPGPDPNAPEGGRDFVPPRYQGANGDGTQAEPPTAPDEFPAYGEDIPTQFCCPKCQYEWSGKPK